MKDKIKTTRLSGAVAEKSFYYKTLTWIKYING